MSKKFKKGDNVIIISGASKGKQGKITVIADDKVVVEGVNIATIHKKPTQNSAGAIIKKEKPIHISNISHVENNKPVKIKFVIDNGDEKPFKRKHRVSKKSQLKL
jgi:large subunit ribosomal protein L24